jgi:hypothetical protein
MAFASRAQRAVPTDLGLASLDLNQERSRRGGVQELTLQIGR